MHKIKLFTALILAILLSACDEENTAKEQIAQAKKEENKIDIYRLTKKLDSQKKSDMKLNEQQQKTVDEIITGVDLFITERKEQSFPTINAHAKKYDWEIQEYNSEEFYQYKAKLKDGSGSSILFRHHQLAQNDIHDIAVWGLTPKQCNYLVNHYKYGAKFKVGVEKFNHGPSKTSSQGSFCSNLGKKDGKDIAVRIEHNNKPYGNNYDDFNEEIVYLFNKEYERAITKNSTSIYFTKEPVSPKIFRGNIDAFRYLGNDIDYVVNTVNNHITIGYVTKDRCKEIIYHLPEDIKYKVNEDNKCSQEVNTIEFFK